MLEINNLQQYTLDNILFVFALDSEAGDNFNHVNKLITGIGKVNAAVALTKEISRKKPELIINLGSAGGYGFSKGEVICCTQFIQRDMDAQGLGFKKFETPLSGIPTVIEHGVEFSGLKKGICGSGDSFETNHINTEYNVIDMEAYPLALIAMNEKIPFLCLKYISDDAGSDAANDWEEQVILAAKAFEQILFNN